MLCFCHKHRGRLNLCRFLQNRWLGQSGGRCVPMSACASRLWILKKGYMQMGTCYLWTDAESPRFTSDLCRTGLTASVGLPILPHLVIISCLCVHLPLGWRKPCWQRCPPFQLTASLTIFPSGPWILPLSQKGSLAFSLGLPKRIEQLEMLSWHK